MKRVLLITAILALLAAGCADDQTPDALQPSPAASATAGVTAAPTPQPKPTSSETAAPTPSPEPTAVPYLRVPADYPTIQAAIDAARDGDEIVVSPGTYRENVDFVGKNVTLRSTNPDDAEVVAATVIDGGDRGTAVTFRNGETVRAVLTGFTITNGSGTIYRASESQEDMACRGSIFGSREERRSCGGGIIVDGAWPTIEKNTITGNRVTHGGGGIFVASAAFPTIRGNTITDNEAGAGAGLFVIKDSWPTIEGNTISRNLAGEQGGGILVALFSAPRIEGNIISENQASTAGAIIVFNYGSAVVKGNTIEGNGVAMAGGAAFVGATSSITLQANLFRGNQASVGAAFFCEVESIADVVGNTFDQNVALSRGGAMDLGGCWMQVANNTFTANRSDYGGAIFDGGNYSLTLEGNTFAANRAHYGGAFYHGAGTSAKLIRNQFTANIAQEGGAVWAADDSPLETSEPDDNVYLDNEPDGLYIAPGASAVQPGTGAVTGWIDYPETSEPTAGLNLFFEDLASQAVTVVPLEPSASTYTASLPTGTYHAYTWLPPDYHLKGAFTTCQPGEPCQDHIMLPITVSNEVTTTDVGIVDWYAPEGEPLAVAGTVIDGTGADPLPDGMLVIREERIVAIGPQAEMVVPAGARLFDLPQTTILPGFINAHVHNAQAATLLANWARAGVTTVRDLGARYGSGPIGPPEPLRAEPKYARVVAAGPLVTVPGGYPIAGNNFPSLTVLSPDDARLKIGDLIDEGAEVIKICIESGAGPTLSDEEAAAIVETAHQRGIPVSAHVTVAADLQRALKAGVDDMAHMVSDPVGDEVIEQMVEGDVAWVPTLAALHGDQSGNLARFVEAGGRVAMGNDAGYLPGLKVGMPLRELEMMQAAGLTPMQIIVAATRDAAYVCRRDGSLGTLEIGKLADVLVVEGDPLSDLYALEKVQVVVHSGTVIYEAGVE